MLHRRQLFGAAGGAAVLSPIGHSPVRAQGPGKIKVGYTATSDCAAAYAAAEEGYFTNAGLDLELQLIALNSTLPAALQSNSIQIGNPSPSVFLAAVDGGLDLVAIGTTSIVDKDVIGRDAHRSPHRGSQGFVGKKVGVPGLNAFLHILFRKRLTDKGVDWKGVAFVEVPYPQMPDVVRGGSVAPL
jgi:NitT/TauT family transport system substrate-binding protein